MPGFPCLEELVVAANSRSIFDGMMLYFKRETTIDLEFAANLHNLWVKFIDRTNDRKLFISELEGVQPSLMSYNCCQFLHQVQENDFIKLLELRKMIVETYLQMHKKIDFVSVMKNILAMVSFCVPVGRTRFDYVYNPSTNLVEMLPELDYAHDDSNFYRCAGLRLTADLTKSPDYKVVRAGSNSCEIYKFTF
nr:hypothetical protein [Tanacetum cinerariifolium]